MFEFWRLKLFKPYEHFRKTKYKILLNLIGDLQAVVPFRRSSWRRSQKISEENLHVNASL